jgi:eukaryotic-like serine/threonine-protein kinase
MSMMTSQYAATVRRSPVASPLAVAPRSPGSEGVSETSSWSEAVVSGSRSAPLRSFLPAQVGDVLDGRFLLKRLAGSGGMGDIFESVDASTGARVAVKLMSEARTPDPVRFEREARVLASFRHPGIVGYVSFGVTSTSAYLAMEWLDGEDLAGRLARGPLTVAETLALGVGVGDALGAIHARGVVHRDIKPGNIFLVDGDVRRAKVLDLGLAQVEDQGPLTKAGTLLGTLGYVAPEQAQCERRIDARADVFSLGCVLFKCLTGTCAFAADNVIALVRLILHADAPALRDRCPAAPAGLDALLARMLAKSPDERPRDGAEVAAALRELTGSACPARPTVH